MKNFAWHRLLLAAALISPCCAGVAAHAEDGGKMHTQDSHHGNGDHHDSEGDGHNEDGSSPASAVFSTTSGPNGNLNSGSSGAIPGVSQFTSGNGSIEHRRFGDIVASPILDTEQTKALIAQGKASSMPLLLAYLNQNYPGQVLDVKLHNANDGFVYEVRYLSNVIVLRTLFLDAATLKAK